MVRARGARAVLAVVVHNTKVHGGIPPLHGRLGIQLKTFKHHWHPLYGAASVGRRERGASHLVQFEQSLPFRCVQQILLGAEC